MRLSTVTPDNVRAACRIAVRPDQEKFVAPVAVSLAQAYAHQDAAWPRLIYDGDDLVGFVMVGVGPDEFGIWRLNIDAAHQGKGYGRFAVQEVLAEARRRGHRRVTVSWVPGPGSPEQFYLRLGFRPTGEESDGEIEGEIEV